MTNSIPVKSPQLLIRPVDETYFYVVNCSFPNSLRLLNKAQYEIICAINGVMSIQALAVKLGIQHELLEEFLLLLTRTEIVRFDQNFTQPEKPQQPESLNYWVHTTNRCNLSCGYCYIPTLNSTGGMIEAVRQQLLNKLVQTVRHRGIKHVRLRLAGGEPLMQFKAWKSFIPEARRTLNELGCRLEFSFITNLTILTDEIIQFSKENNISFGVSLDGVRQHHDATRAFRSGAGSFETVNNNLCRLVANQIPVSVNTVVSNSNLNGLYDLTRYLIDLNIPFRYSLVKGESIDADLLETHLSGAYALMKTAVQIGWAFTSQHQFCDLKPSSLGYQTCASGFSGGAIAVDGTVNYCHVHFGDKNRSVHTLGDESIDLVDMIEQGSHEENDRSPDCQSCRYKSVCTSGCPVYRVNGKEPQCSLYHRFIPMIYDIQAMERLILMQNCTKM